MYNIYCILYANMRAIEKDYDKFLEERDHEYSKCIKDFKFLIQLYY